ncbi:hypothetical protein AALO_G00162720 [Alosa alosa]|uniref:Uncharacterized protein n=1 Tax=Alosa alosa TaxID=278164 RepID=A0AAV6GFN6_9TELE|nr:hypothetical protein AALO_G00162720 [Alosa alosa]
METEDPKSIILIQATASTTSSFDWLKKRGEGLSDTPATRTESVKAQATLHWQTSERVCQRQRSVMPPKKKKGDIQSFFTMQSL